MPTPTGLPKKGEVWMLQTYSSTRDEHKSLTFKVFYRSPNKKWELLIEPIAINNMLLPAHHRALKLLPDASLWHKIGKLRFMDTF